MNDTKVTALADRQDSSRPPVRASSLDYVLAVARDLPFVCRTHPPLIFRRRRISWSEIAPIDHVERLIGQVTTKLTGHPGTFVSAGLIETPRELVMMSPEGLTFLREGAYNLV